MEKYYLKWPITKECPLNCKFCNNKYSREKWSNELTSYEADRFIDFVNQEDAISGITITGGEPLVAKNFVNVCQKLQKPFGFISSGYDISNKKYDLIFENVFLKFVTLSIDCLRPGVVGEIRGRDILKNQLDALEYMNTKREASSEFEIFVNTVVSKANMKFVLELLDHLHKAGVNRIQLFKCASSGNSDIDEELMLSHKEEIEVADNIITHYLNHKKVWEEDNFKVLIRFLPGCAEEYWESKKELELPIYPGVCGIPRNTLYLKTDTRVNLCKVYDSNLRNEIKGSKISDLDFDYLINDILEPGKDKFMSYSHYHKYYPCSECKKLNISCHPCINLNQDGLNQVKIEDCARYKKSVV